MTWGEFKRQVDRRLVEIGGDDSVLVESIDVDGGEFLQIEDVLMGDGEMGLFITSSQKERP